MTPVPELPARMQIENILASQIAPPSEIEFAFADSLAAVGDLPSGDLKST